MHQLLEATLHELLPPTKSVEITNRWGGSLGVHRDWHPSVLADRTTGQASAGGYVGDGVAFSCLAAEALSHEILNTDNEIRTCLIHKLYASDEQRGLATCGGGRRHKHNDHAVVMRLVGT